jgi:hypothetical protein
MNIPESIPDHDVEKFVKILFQKYCRVNPRYAKIDTITTDLIECVHNLLQQETYRQGFSYRINSEDVAAYAIKLTRILFGWSDEYFFDDGVELNDVDISIQEDLNVWLGSVYIQTCEV